MKKPILQLISALSEGSVVTYYCYILLKILAKEVVSKKNLLLTFASLFAMTALINLVDIKIKCDALNNVAMVIVVAITMKFGFNVKWKKAILVAVIYGIILGMCKMLINIILSVLFGNKSCEFLNVSGNLTLILLVKSIFSFAIITGIYLIYVHNAKFKEYVKLLLENEKVLLVVPLVYIVWQMIMLTLSYNCYKSYLLVIDSTQMILVSFLVSIYFKDVVTKEKIETELNETELHNKVLVEIIDGVRTLKHDYGNIIQALNGYVVTKEYGKLNEYVNSLLEEFGSVNNASVIDPKIFNEPSIYGVVGAKYFYAMDINIPFEIKVASDIKSISFSKPELSRIFGILLDNAIDATKKVDNKYIKLEIYFDEKKYADVIRVINTYDDSVDIDLDRIYEKGVSSKKVKSGIGLWEVSKLVKKNKHSQIYATVENDKFVQNLIIERLE